MSAEAEKRLHELLLKMFDEFELRSRLPLEVPGGDAVRLSLPGGNASRLQLAQAWVEQVAHMREQDAFFDALLRLRPRWSGEIGLAREVWGRATAQQVLTQTPGHNGTTPSNAAVSEGPWWRPVEAQDPLRAEIELISAIEWDEPIPDGAEVPAIYRIQERRFNQSGAFRLPWTTEKRDSVRLRLSDVQKPATQSELARWGLDLRDGLQGFDAFAALLYSSDRPVELTLRVHQATLMSLPWELLMLQTGPDAQPLVLYPGWRVLRRLPQLGRLNRPGPKGSGGSLMFAWSSAGGSIPLPGTLKRLQSATGARGVELVEVPNARALDIYEQARKLDREGKPPRVLCLLCHGRPLPGSSDTWALCLGEPGDGEELLESGQLATLLLGPLCGVEALVLLACNTANPGPADNPLGSVAQGAWKAGVAVLAPQIPLSTEGAVAVADAVFSGMLEDKLTFAGALPETVQRLRIVSRRTSDWASLTLLAPDR